MSVLTKEKLLHILTPSLDTSVHARAISKDDYIARKEVLTKNLSRTLGVLYANHWDNLSKSIKMSSHRAPVEVLIRVKRKSELIYQYLVDIYAALTCLRLIENAVESSIEYEQPAYER